MVFNYNSENWSLPTPQIGHVQSSGSSLNAFPVSLGSYSYPQTSQMYFAIVIKFYVNKLLFALQNYCFFLIYANFGTKKSARWVQIFLHCSILS